MIVKLSEEERIINYTLNELENNVQSMRNEEKIEEKYKNHPNYSKDFNLGYRVALTDIMCKITSQKIGVGGDIIDYLDEEDFDSIYGKGAYKRNYSEI